MRGGKGANQSGGKDVKSAPTSHLVAPVIANRWSPYSFDATPLDQTEIDRLFEAARWAASCYNEQPWYYIMAPRSDEQAFNEALSCLIEFNRTWAGAAGLLVFGIYQDRFEGRDELNPAAAHDLGQASATLALQAADMGLQAHQMLGIDPERVRECYSVPKGYQPFTAIVVGRPRLDLGEDKLTERDQMPRERRPISEFVFTDR